MFEEEWSFDQAPPPAEPRGVLPEGLGEAAPGPELAAMLEGVDPEELNGHELVVLLRARARQIAHLQAGLYADMWELAFSPPGYIDSPSERTGTVDEFVSDEVAAALTLTPRNADAQVSLAYGLSELPAVHEALREGRIDLPRARVFVRETDHLESDEARDIAEEVLPDAAELTTSRLAALLRRRCRDKHPDKARRRYEEARKERRVESFANPDGTADLCARQLPLERAASILGRINTLARQLRGQDDRTMDQIRADILMDLLEGRRTHLGQGAGSVEIRVDLTTLLELDERCAEIPGWGPIIADLARKVVSSQHDSPWQATVTDPATGLPIWTGPTRRRPTADQRRHVISRNPTCSFPGCAMPAIRSHIDHTIDHASGGPTEIHNLGPLCARHHLRAKHRAGWRLAQTQPGKFLWTSPRHHQYVVRPPPG